MNGIMKQLTDLLICCDQLKPVNCETTSYGNWVKVYAEKDYAKKYL